MLEISKRQLTDEELTKLVEEKEKIIRKKRFHYRFTLVSLSFLFVAAVLLLYFFLESASVGLIVLALGLILIYSLSVVWGYKQNAKMFLENIEEIDEAISLDYAIVYKCYAKHCASFQNKSLDEPAHFFEFEDKKLFFLSGFDFYPNERFPNSDFEVVVIKSKEGKNLQSNLICKGIFLKPNIVLSDKLKKILRDQKKYPENLSVMPGNLEELEQVLLS